MKAWIDEWLMPEFLKLEDVLNILKSVVVLVVLSVLVLVILFGVPALLGFKFELCNHQYVPAKAGTVAMCAKCAKVVELEVRR